jgi:hypothetical protein
VRAALAIAALLAPGAALAQAIDDGVGERVHASALAAESYQGPLDGAWTLVSTSGNALYAFQLVDKPGGDSPLEGVWRDLRHTPTPGDINAIDSLSRAPGSLTISFTATPGQAVTIELRSDAFGVWSGDLRQAGADLPVKMRRG